VEKDKKTSTGVEGRINIPDDQVQGSAASSEVDWGDVVDDSVEETDVLSLLENFFQQDPFTSSLPPDTFKSFKREYQSLLENHPSSVEANGKHYVSLWNNVDRAKTQDLASRDKITKWNMRLETLNHAMLEAESEAEKQTIKSMMAELAVEIQTQGKSEDGAIPTSLMTSEDGVDPDHRQAIMNVCKRVGMVLGIRGLEASALALIKAGFYAKDFTVKEKTAKYGPLVNTINIIRRMNKSWKKGQEAELDVAKLVETGKYSGGHEACDAVLPLEQLDYLLKNPKVGSNSYSD
jgi:hypothetical protein